MQTNIKFGTDDFFYMRNTGTSQSVPSESDCSIKYNIVPDASCVEFNPAKSFRTALYKCDFYNHNNVADCMDASGYGVDYNKFITWQDNSGNCYKRELCKNRELATKTKTTESIHLGTGQKHSDVDKIYDTEYNKTIHMGLGILLLSGAIYYTVS